MSTLGEILTRMNDGTDLHGLLAQIDDPVLLAGMEEQARASCRKPEDIAREAVQHFCAHADDEAWVKLIGRLQDAPSPAAVCLKEILAWSRKS